MEVQAGDAYRTARRLLLGFLSVIVRDMVFESGTITYQFSLLLLLLFLLLLLRVYGSLRRLSEPYLKTTGTEATYNNNRHIIVVGLKHTLAYKNGIGNGV